MSEPRSIIRNEKGKPDDVVIEGVTCFRLERMNTGHVWIAAYRGEQRVTFGLYSKRKIEIEVIEDEVGCVDDTGDIDAPLMPAIEEFPVEANWLGIVEGELLAVRDDEKGDGDANR